MKILEKKQLTPRVRKLLESLNDYENSTTIINVRDELVDKGYHCIYKPEQDILQIAGIDDSDLGRIEGDYYYPPKELNQGWEYIRDYLDEKGFIQV